MCIRDSRSCLYVVDSVVPVQSNLAGNSAGDSGVEGGTMPTVYGPEAGISDSADNATYCRGVQPITIEPMDCESDVEPLTCEESLPSNVAATLRQNTADMTRAAGDGVAQPAMRVVYCGTVSGNQLLEQNALGGLAPNLIGASSLSLIHI